MDLEIVETGNGGDLIGKGRDLSIIYSFENMPYLGLFGGNVEAVTATRIEGQQSFDWWANSLIFPNSPDLQFNSLTEKALIENVLNSQGKRNIDNAIISDLSFMSPFAIIKVNTYIESDDRLRIDIGIRQPDNLEEKKYIYIWENGNISVVNNEYVAPTPFVEEGGLDYELQFDL